MYPPDERSARDPTLGRPESEPFVPSAPVVGSRGARLAPSQCFVRRLSKLNARRESRRWPNGELAALHHGSAPIEHTPSPPANRGPNRRPKAKRQYKMAVASVRSFASGRCSGNWPTRPARYVSPRSSAAPRLAILSKSQPLTFTSDGVIFTPFSLLQMN